MIDLAVNQGLLVNNERQFLLRGRKLNLNLNAELFELRFELRFATRTALDVPEAKVINCKINFVLYINSPRIVARIYNHSNIKRSMRLVVA